MNEVELDCLFEWLRQRAGVPCESPQAIQIDRVRRMVKDAYCEGKRMERGEREIERQKRKAERQEQVRRRTGVAEDV